MKTIQRSKHLIVPHQTCYMLQYVFKLFSTGLLIWVAALFFHYLSSFSSSVHLCASIFILLPMYRTEHVRAIFDFTSYAGFVFFWNATFHSKSPLPPLPPFLLLSFYPPFLAPPTFLFSRCHLPLTRFVLSLCSLTKMSCFLSVWFLPLCFHLSLSGVQCSLYANTPPMLRKQAA